MSRVLPLLLVSCLGLIIHAQLLFLPPAAVNAPGVFLGLLPAVAPPLAARPRFAARRLYQLPPGEAAVECSTPGFFRLPSDCARFYRCVDISEGNGYFQAYHFSCPANTVFDPSLGVCNFPWAANPPCPPPVEETPVVVVDEEQEEEQQQVVVVAPTFAYQCTSPGLFAHESDCSRFWLCTQSADEVRLSSALYRCPEGFLFDAAVRRCLSAAAVACDKTPDLGRIAREPRPIQLRLIDVQPFFAMHRY